MHKKYIGCEGGRMMRLSTENNQPHDVCRVLLSKFAKSILVQTCDSWTIMVRKLT